MDINIKFKEVEKRWNDEKAQNSKLMISNGR